MAATTSREKLARKRERRNLAELKRRTKRGIKERPA